MKLATKLRLIYLSEFFVFFHLFGGVLIPFFTIWGGLSLTELMLVQAWFSVLIVLFELPSGVLADRFGRKKTIILGTILNIAGVILYVTSPNLWIFLLAEVFWAGAFACFSGAKEALLYDTLVDHKKTADSDKAFGGIKQSHLFALLISAPLGSWIGAQYGFEWAVFLMIIPLGLSALVLWFVPEPKARLAGPEIELIPSSKPASRDLSLKSYVKDIRIAWKVFKEHPSLRAISFDMVMIWSLAFMMIWFNQVLLLQLGVDEKYFGWFASFGLITQMIVLKSYEPLSRWLGSKQRMIHITGYLPAIGFLSMAIFPSVWTVLLGFFLCTGYGLTRRTLLSSAANKFIESHNRSTVNSVMNLGIHVVSAIIKPILGFLADLSILWTFGILGILCLIVAMISNISEETLAE